MLKDHNAVTPVRLEPTAYQSWVKHSTTEPLHYQFIQLGLDWTSTKQGLMCLAQEHNAMTPVRLEFTTPRSRVKHSYTTETLCCMHLWCMNKLGNILLFLSSSFYWLDQMWSLLTGADSGFLEGGGDPPLSYIISNIVHLQTVLRPRSNTK